MTTEAKELTNFPLGRSQKLALKERAKANGTNVAEEIRSVLSRRTAVRQMDMSLETYVSHAGLLDAWLLGRDRRILSIRQRLSGVAALDAGSGVRTAILRYGHQL